MTPKFSVESAAGYGRHYDEPSFWKKLKKVSAQAGAKVLYPALQLYYLMQSPSVPTKDKALIVGALGYLILPTDLVPDIVPMLGFTDDLTALMVVVRMLGRHITPEIRRQAREQAGRLLGAAATNAGGENG